MKNNLFTVLGKASILTLGRNAYGWEKGSEPCYL